MDNRERSLGYSGRFGITHVNFKTLKRTIKESGLLYAEVSKSQGEVLNTLQSITSAGHKEPRPGRAVRGMEPASQPARHW
jgi:hypothetical protein